MNKRHGSAIGDWLRACADLQVQDGDMRARVAHLLGLELHMPQVLIPPVEVLPIREETAPVPIETAPAKVEKPQHQEAEPPAGITYLEPIRTERPSAQDLQKPMLTIQSKPALNQAIFLPGGGILTSSDLVVWDELSGQKLVELFVDGEKSVTCMGIARHIAQTDAYDVEIFVDAPVQMRAQMRRMRYENQRLNCQLFIMPGVADIACVPQSPSIYFVDKKDKIRMAFPVGQIVEQGDIAIANANLISIAVEHQPDPQRIVCGDRDGRVHLIEKGTAIMGNPEISSEQAHKAPVLAVAFSPDSLTFASGAGNGEVKLWDPSSLELTPKLTLHGHTGAIFSLTYHPSQPYLASGSVDMTIRIWHTTTGQCRLTLSPGRSPITSIAWNTVGSRLLASADDGQVHLWDFAVLQALMGENTPKQTAAPASPSGGSESPTADLPPRPRLQPLFHPDWQPGLLQGLTATLQEIRSIDLPSIVAHAASLQPFRDLPWQRQFRSGRAVQLLIDRDDQMMAFLQDSKDLEKQCRRLFGKEALDIQRFHSDPTEGAGPGPIWDWQPYQPPAPGTHIVLVSNLGAMPWHEGFESPRWRRFARRVADAGCQLTCLSPLRPTRYSPGLVRALRIVQWDRRTQLAHIHRLARP